MQTCIPSRKQPRKTKKKHPRRRRPEKRLSSTDCCCPTKTTKQTTTAQQLIDQSNLSSVLAAEWPQLRADVVVQARRHVPDSRLPRAALELTPRPNATDAHNSANRDHTDHRQAEADQPASLRPAAVSLAAEFLSLVKRQTRGAVEGLLTVDFVREDTQPWF